MQTHRPEMEEVFGNASLPHGMAQVFLEVWPAVRAALDELVTREDTAPQIWVAGYSMGAAGAALLCAKAGRHTPCFRDAASTADAGR